MKDSSSFETNFTQNSLESTQSVAYTDAQVPLTSNQTSRNFGQINSHPLKTLQFHQNPKMKRPRLIQQDLRK